jgi:hypothetical protein
MLLHKKTFPYKKLYSIIENFKVKKFVGKILLLVPTYVSIYYMFMLCPDPQMLKPRVILL